MDRIILKIRKEMKEKAEEKTQKSGQRFFKEKILLYGVKATAVRKIAKERFKDIQKKTKEDIFSLCEIFLKSGYLEESFIACHWVYFLKKAYQPEDIFLFERWIEEYIHNWASCDTFCNHTIGYFMEMYPEYLSRLKIWAKSPNLWVRRAAAVSLVVPAKQGKFLKNIFEIADILLLDKEDMVQKGYGWLLKETSHLHEKEVLEYVLRHKATMPRTALRYAIEKMPKECKERAMKKSKSFYKSC